MNITEFASIDDGFLPRLRKGTGTRPKHKAWPRTHVPYEGPNLQGVRLATGDRKEGQDLFYEPGLFTE